MSIHSHGVFRCSPFTEYQVVVKYILYCYMFIGSIQIYVLCKTVDVMIFFSYTFNAIIIIIISDFNASIFLRCVHFEYYIVWKKVVASFLFNIIFFVSLFFIYLLVSCKRWLKSFFDHHLCIVIILCMHIIHVWKQCEIWENRLFISLFHWKIMRDNGYIKIFVDFFL